MTDLPSIAAHAKLHNISPQKRLGQNFIFDSSLCDKIVRAAPNKLDGKYVIEIGPGPAGLTRAILASNPKQLIVIEKDQRCIALLKDIQRIHSNLTIIEGDALAIPISQLTDDKVMIISNLPYNIGTELVFRWLEDANLIESMTLMLQKEVVERICAKHSTKAYGKLSVMCQVMANVNKQFDVSPKAFYPPPKIYSSIVNIIPFYHIIDKNILSKIREITHLAFTARRKMLRSSLKSIPEHIFTDLGIETTIRAENISPALYTEISKKLV